MNILVRGAVPLPKWNNQPCELAQGLDIESDVGNVSLRCDAIAPLEANSTLLTRRLGGAGYHRAVVAGGVRRSSSFAARPRICFLQIATSCCTIQHDTGTEHRAGGACARRASYTFGGRLTAGQGTLDPCIEVQILTPEPRSIEFCGVRHPRRRPAPPLGARSPEVDLWNPGALSSAAERPAHNRLVAGSNPAGPIAEADANPALVVGG